MFETITGISIEGRCFASKTELTFFPPKIEKDGKEKKYRLALVYGKNGSGKTTCSKAFSLCNDPSSSTGELSAQLCNKEKSPHELPTPLEGWKDIHVFDEDYVMNNLHIEKDGLGSIVLLGKQVDIDKQLKMLTEKKEKSQKELDPIQQSVNQFSDHLFNESPLFLKKQIFDKLRADGAWAEIDRSIKIGQKVNTPVNDGLFNEFRTMEVTDTLESLQRVFHEKKSLYERSANSEQQYPMSIQQEIIENGIDEKIQKILAKAVEKPVLSERDQKIFNILTSISNRKDEIVESFSKQETDICPYCFQEVSPEYKNKLLETISSIFKKEADLFKSNIHGIKIQKITRNFTEFSNLDAELVLHLQEHVNVCNSIIDTYNKLLEQKYNDVFTPIEIPSQHLGEKIFQLNEKINELENKRQEFMQAIQKSTELRNELILLNKKVYKKITEGLFRSYENSLKKQEAAQTQLSEITERIKDIDAKIIELQQKKENIYIAIEQINRDLEYVFFSKNRVVLEPHETFYSLKINGKSVKPKDVSCGERNAIALCYFFTESFRKKNLSNAYAEESLFVIDDPVSSFDIGNRVGINSYLKYKIQSIIRGNSNSKVLIFSHDIVTMWDLEKAFQEICNNETSSLYLSQELDNFSLIDFHSKKRNEYSSLMERTYAYAVDKTGDSQSIGNIVRRMLEAFSSFIYRKNIEELSYSPDISGKFNQKSLFFNNLMYRLVLHGESHAADAARADTDEMLCFCYATDDEKQKMARYIIAMMYCLQKDHTLIHLKTAGVNVQQNIEEWLAEIPSNGETIQPDGEANQQESEVTVQC